jgi:hypothetical protein
LGNVAFWQNFSALGRQLDAQTNFIKKNYFHLKIFNNYYFKETNAVFEFLGSPLSSPW